MCETVAGETIKLPRTVMYKVIHQSGGGVYFNPIGKHKIKGKWNWLSKGKVFTDDPEKIRRHQTILTISGIHVFETLEGAKFYLFKLWNPYLIFKIIKVEVRGKAIPFEYDNYKGYAVQYAKVI